MNVYPTRRTAALPKAVTDRVVAQAGKVSLQGFGLQDLNGSTTPFPIPENGLEAIWNHLVRYLGGGVDPRRTLVPGAAATATTSRSASRSQRIYAQNVEDAGTQPALLRAGLFHRAGDAARHDLPGARTGGPGGGAALGVDLQLRARAACAARRTWRTTASTTARKACCVTDQVDGYNGAPDRYDWKLLGKREMYVPYNDYKLSDKSLKYKDIIGRTRSIRDLVRYELHRVWVVEGTLKPGQRHVYAQAHVLSRRGQLERARGGCVRHARRPVARVAARPDPVLRRAGAVVPLRHLPRPQQRRVPRGRLRQRDQGADRVQREGQGRRLPAGRVAAARRRRCERRRAHSASGCASGRAAANAGSVRRCRATATSAGTARGRSRSAGR